MQYTLSLFHKFETGDVTETVELSLDELLSALACEPDLNTSGNKKLGPCFAPGRYADAVMSDTTHSDICAVAMDFDGDAHGPLTVEQRTELVASLKTLSVSFVWYETYSQGLRVVLPCARVVSASEYETLYDAVAFAASRPADGAARAASRKSAFPQVPSVERQAAHRYEIVVQERLLAPEMLDELRKRAVRSGYDAPTVTPQASNKSIFAGLRLSQVGKRRATNAAELEHNLSQVVDGTKDDTLFRESFRVGTALAEAGDDLDAALPALIEAGTRGLNAAANRTVKPADFGGARGFAAAVEKIERKVREGFAQKQGEIQNVKRLASQASDAGSKPASETAESTEDSEPRDADTLKAIEKLVLRRIPKSKRDAIAKLIKNRSDKGGSLRDGAYMLGRYVSPTLTVDHLCAYFARQVALSEQITSVPDAQREFREFVEEAAPPADWRVGLVRDDFGAVGSDENGLYLLQNHPDCSGALIRNVRVPRRAWLQRPVPWCASTGEIDPESVRGSYAQWARRELGCSTFGIKRANQVLQTHVYDLATEEIDPLLNWFETLPECADGELEVLENVASYVFGDHSPAAAKFFRWWATSLCARAIMPGVKADYAIVFVSPNQGPGKTSAIEALFPEDLGTLVAGVKLEDKALPVKMSELAVGVLDEIDQIASRTDSARMKEIITERVAQGHVLFVGHQTFKRRAVFAGTSNHADFAYDMSGARRYWPINVTHDVVTIQTRLREIRETIWAQAFSEAQRCIESRLTLPYEQWRKFWPTTTEHTELCAPAQDVLTVRETPASATLRELVDCLPPELVKDTLDKDPLKTIKLYPGQKSGQRLIWVTLNQIGALLNLSGYKATSGLKDTIHAAGLRLKRGTKRYYRAGETDAPDAPIEASADVVRVVPFSARTN